MRRIVELDGLRAFAIIAVVACHYYPLSTLLFKLPEFGWVGVEVFFVLSGFLITSILLQLKSRPHPYKVFYARRILRIFPPYYAVMFLILATALLQHDSISWLRFAGKALFLQSFSKEFNTLNHVFAHLSGRLPVPNPFAIAPLPPTLDRFSVPGFSNTFGPTWSLSIEEWFYILWAPLVLHLRRRTLALSCVGICLAALFMRWFGFLGIDTYFDFFSRIDVLIGGALLALWIEHRRSLPPAAQRRGDLLLYRIAALSAAALLAILFVIRPVLGFEIRESLLFTVFGLPLLGLCVAGLLSSIILHQESRRPINRFLRLKPLVTIGTVSYTLYLIHVPIYLLVNQAAARMNVAASEYLPALFISLISAALAFTAAQLSFTFFETPILAYKEKLTDLLTGGAAATDREPVSVAVEKAHAAAGGSRKP
jgi:peptidoglycan/LPS O-acetylase OafA/YrhL